MPAPQQLARAARGSTVITHPPAGVTSAPTITSGAWTTLRRVMFTAKDVADPERLYQVLYKVQDLVHQGLGPVVQNPLLNGNHVRGVAFTAGQTVTLSHGLARPYSGYHCTRAQGGYPSFQESALASGLSSDASVALTSANAGTFDFYFF